MTDIPLQQKLTNINDPHCLIIVRTSDFFKKLEYWL